MAAQAKIDNISMLLGIFKRKANRDDDDDDNDDDEDEGSDGNHTDVETPPKRYSSTSAMKLSSFNRERPLKFFLKPSSSAPSSSSSSSSAAAAAAAASSSLSKKSKLRKRLRKA